jgi:GAF domain-containing protein
MRDNPIRVLLVDDEESLCMSLAKWLKEEHGYSVEIAADGSTALQILAEQACFDVALLDYLLPPPHNGISLMKQMMGLCPAGSIEFIIFTGWGLDPHVGVQALKAGAYRYLAKPFNEEELAILIQSIVEMRATEKELEATSREKLWLASLLEVSKSVNSTLELDQVLPLILDEMKRLVPYDSATIQRMTEQGLHIVASRGFPSPERLLTRVFPSSYEYPNYRVWQSRQALIVEDMRTIYPATQVRGWLGVPLICRGEAIGVITLDSQEPGFYGQDDARIAGIFAHQAAIAVENARLHRQTQNRAETLHRLLDIGQQITRVTDRPKGVLEVIARMAGQVAGADCAVIYPYYAERRVYDKDNIASFGLRRPFTPGDKLREYGKSVGARIIGEPAGMCILSDVAQDTEWGSESRPLRESPFIVREGIQAFAGVRLDFGPEPVGVLFVNFRNPHHFTDDQMEIIQLFANQAAVAIWNARVYGRTSDKLEQKVAELRTVSEIDQLIISTLDLDKVLPLILDKVMRLLDVPSGSLQLVDEETGELIIRLQRGPTAVPPRQIRLKPGEGITGKAAQEKRSIIVPDVTQPPWRDNYVELWPGTRSELAVPLLTDEQCIGVLNLEHPEVGYFGEDQREIIEGLAVQAAIAIQNAQRYHELERAKGALAAAEAIAWMGLFGSSWAHSVAQKTSAVRNYLAVLADYLPPERKAQDLMTQIEDAVRAIQHIPTIVHELPSAPGMTATLDLDAALRDQVRRWCRPRPEVELVFDLGCAGVQACIEKDWLNVALEKLIGNALRAMPGGGQLKLDSLYRGNQVEVRITDTGCGLSEKIRPYFLKERIPPELSGSSGTGIGVLIARYIFRAFGGDLELLWSEPGRGTVLQVTLPGIPLQAWPSAQARG